MHTTLPILIIAVVLITAGIVLWAYFRNRSRQLQQRFGPVSTSGRFARREAAGVLRRSLKSGNVAWQSCIFGPSHEEI